VPTKSHHAFTGVPYHHHMGEHLQVDRFGREVDQQLGAIKVV
jgi:hypothetical protein